MIKRRLALGLALLTAGISGVAVSLTHASACGSYGDYFPELHRSVSTDPIVRDAALASLRAEGQAGLDRLIAHHQWLVDRVLEVGVEGLSAHEAERWARASHAIDTVAQQRDAHASGLYWYNDKAAALAAAKASGKPVLSLRMLGKLTDELSCANSRLFRSVLYADASVAALLKDKYVLHWSSERAVPQVTIDFGDGRTVKTTITGNSIHYVLDGEGRVIDALPGLFAPSIFKAELEASAALNTRLAGLKGQARAATLAQHHRAALGATSKALRSHAKRLDIPTTRLVSSAPGGDAADPPVAARAVPMAVSKMAIERPLIPLEGPIDVRVDPKALDAADWKKLAGLYQDRAGLDARAEKLVAAKSKAFLERVAGDKAAQALARRLDALRALIAEDSAKNDLALRPVVRSWLAANAGESFDTLNRRVYSELFLTPASDPWLGLLSPSVYAAIDGEGIVMN